MPKPTLQSIAKNCGLSLIYVSDGSSLDVPFERSKREAANDAEGRVAA